jgi:hypothetical protein
MPSAKDLIERARMFEERAERARDPISRQHYREMAAHYRSLSVEHQEAMSPLERESAQWTPAFMPAIRDFFKQIARGAIWQTKTTLSLSIGRCKRSITRTASASDPKLNAEMRDLKSKAALTAAIASARLGNDRAAQRYKQLAIANGSKKATNLALPFFSLVPSAPMR